MWYPVRRHGAGESTTGARGRRAVGGGSPRVAAGADTGELTMRRPRIEPLERRAYFAVTASFASGTLTVSGDALDNAIAISRNAAGTILVNGGAVAVAGGTPTVANTSLIQAFGQDGNDTVTLDEASGALPAASLQGGNG